MINSFFKKGNLRFPFFVIIGLITLYFIGQFLKTPENKSQINLLYGTTFTLNKNENVRTVYEADSLTVSQIQKNFKQYPVYKFISHDSYDIYILMSLNTRKDKFDSIKLNTFSKAITQKVKGLHYITKKNKEFIALLTSNDSTYTIPNTILYDRFKENK